MLTELQKRTAQAVVNVFETGKVLGDYGAIVVLAGDTGHLSYGRSQATLGSGNLYRLIREYCAAPGALYAQQLSLYLERLRRRDITLDNDATLKGLLRNAGGDPLMRHAQDSFFDRHYWLPATRACKALSISSALGACVVYDSFIHGSFRLIRDRVKKDMGTPGSARMNEQGWIAAYVELRKKWLAGHSNPRLRPTVYRMHAFQGLIAQERWQLELPLAVRGIVIDEVSLDAAPPARILRLREPHLRGDDVRRIQEALVAAGFPCVVNGDFSPETEAAVRGFQSARNLAVDGVVGAQTRVALGNQRAAAAKV